MTPRRGNHGKHYPFRLSHIPIDLCPRIGNISRKWGLTPLTAVIRTNTVLSGETVIKKNKVNTNEEINRKKK